MPSNLSPNDRKRLTALAAKDPDATPFNRVDRHRWARTADWHTAEDRTLIRDALNPPADRRLSSSPRVAAAIAARF